MDYFKASFSRKIARRIFKKYGYRIDKFDLGEDGVIEFANWLNPLIKPYVLTKRQICFFREIIPNGSFAIDIGAHVGSQTVPMALAAGSNGMILALEPNPQVFEGLELNSTLNKGKYNIIPLQVGAADIDGAFHFASSEASLSNGGIILNSDDNSLGKHRLKETVETIRVSNYLSEHFPEKLNKLSFIKIDAEGFDLAILKDLCPLLKQYRPIVIAEVYFSKTRSLSKQECHEMYSVLKTLGYNLYNVENFEVSAGLNELIKEPLLNKEDMPMGHTYNLLAVYPHR